MALPHRRPESARHVAPSQASFAVHTRTGKAWHVGPDAAAFVLRVPDVAYWHRLLKSDAYHLATAFIDGVFEIDGDVPAAIRWWRAQHGRDGASWTVKAALRLRLEPWFQTRRRARRNIEFHYDRSNEFYEQFLDRRFIYSSAYFTDPSVSLDEAQLAKLDHIVRKLDIEAGERFLDIGCGWGALVMHAAERGRATAVGCTLSRRQYEFATNQVRTRNLTGRVAIENRDYRTLAGTFDKIASIGMYEHVGRRRLTEYFGTLAGLMAPDGLLLNSGIARPETVSDDAATLFLHRFVFPGGEIPYLADVVRAAESAGLEVLDVENQRHHYALTCAKWVERLQQRRAACVALVGAETYRTWVLYLAGSVVSFERGESELYQILFGKQRAGAPRHWTRDYMYR